VCSEYLITKNVSSVTSIYTAKPVVPLMMSLKDIPGNGYDSIVIEHTNMAHPVPVFTVLQQNPSQGTKSKSNTYENKMFRGYLGIRENEKQ
jgi:hypothetical protein